MSHPRPESTMLSTRRRGGALCCPRKTVQHPHAHAPAEENQERSTTAAECNAKAPGMRLAPRHPGGESAGVEVVVYRLSIRSRWRFGCDRGPWVRLLSHYLKRLATARTGDQLTRLIF